MIAVDTSALMAIVLGEPEADGLHRSFGSRRRSVDFGRHRGEGADRRHPAQCRRRDDTRRTTALMTLPAGFRRPGGVPTASARLDAFQIPEPLHRLLLPQQAVVDA